MNTINVHNPPQEELVQIEDRPSQQLGSPSELPGNQALPTARPRGREPQGQGDLGSVLRERLRRRRAMIAPDEDLVFLAIQAIYLNQVHQDMEPPDDVMKTIAKMANS